MDGKTQPVPLPPPLQATAVLPLPLASAAPLALAAPLQGRRASQPTEACVPLLLREALADHHFQRCLERGPLRELWQVAAPDGRLRVAQLLRGVATRPGDQWLERLLQVVDPALPRLNAVRLSVDQTILLTDLWPATLQERFQECRAQGLRGVPRPELLGYLLPVAQTLDQLQRQFRLQHLNLHPGSLLLTAERVQLEGFGLAQLLWLPARVPLTYLQDDYAARELHGGCVSTQCDQYSLALIFAEMLTGVHPVRGSEGRRSHVARHQGAPQLDHLQQADRAILMRALDPHPQRRFPNSLALLQALADTLSTRSELSHLAPLIVLPGNADCSVTVAVAATDESFAHRLWVRAGGDVDLRECDRLRFRLKPGERLEHQCTALVTAETLSLQLEEFRQHWRCRVLYQGSAEVRLALPLERRGWLARAVGLELHLQLFQVAAPTLPHVNNLGRTGRPTRPDSSGEPSYVKLTLTPFGCRPAVAIRLLEEWGPRILRSVREYLKVETEQRAQERLLWQQPLRIHPIQAGQRLSAAIEGVAKDISPNGMGLYVPRLPGAEVYVQWPEQADVAQLAALARVVREQPRGDGWFEVGAVWLQA